jgi:chromosome segregation ATPase
MNHLNTKPGSEVSGEALSRLTEDLTRRFANLETRVRQLASVLERLEQSLATASKTRSQLAQDVAELKTLLPKFATQVTELSSAAKSFGMQLSKQAECLHNHESRLATAESKLTEFTDSMSRFADWVASLPRTPPPSQT